MTVEVGGWSRIVGSSAELSGSEVPSFVRRSSFVVVRRSSLALLVACDRQHIASPRRVALRRVASHRFISQCVCE